MTSRETPDISVVLPTYNRADALRTNLGAILALEGVLEVIVVDDGSQDETASVLASFDDPKLRVVRQPENRRQPAARNLGAETARGAWILFAEDDCRFPPDYALVLEREAAVHGADIVGAPFIHAAAEKLEEAVRRARATAEPRIELDGEIRFPISAIETPFLPAPALIRRTVFDAVRFDEDYRGNAWREETDFFVTAMRNGFTCVLTPATYAYQIENWDGGARQPRLRYEYWAIRNNWRFLRRHGAWLAQGNYLSRPVLNAQIAFVIRRFRTVSSGFLRTRWRTLTGRGQR
ncbi:MAG: glycosyltransferase family 2 protein [Gaiellaceae bacterium]